MTVGSDSLNTAVVRTVRVVRVGRTTGGDTTGVSLSVGGGSLMTTREVVVATTVEESGMAGSDTTSVVSLRVTAVGVLLS